MKEIGYVELFNIYSRLLTARQADIFESYYCFDLSLSEIASEYGVTRQSIADSLKKTRSELDELESKLGVLALKRSLSEFSKELDEGMRERLAEILDKADK